MGIRGLATFVDNNQELLTHHKLHDTRVIIDGNNLYHFLFYHYKVSFQYGGDYDHYSRKCKLFFNILRSCHVTPYVVFDGGYDPSDRKLPTVLTRMTDRRSTVGLLCATGRGNVLPILTYETFRQVLVEMGVAHVSCRYEADREIAVLANEWNCPVMSNDSDFHAYPLTAGYIPLDYINLTSCVFDTLTGKESILSLNHEITKHEYVYIPVKLYNYRNFVSKYSKDVQEIVLPFLATLLSNDYVDIADLSEFYSKLNVPKHVSKSFQVPKGNTRLIGVLNWLDCLTDSEQGLDKVLKCLPEEKKEKMRECLEKSLEEYGSLNSYESLNLRTFFEESETVMTKNEVDESENCKHLSLLDFNEKLLPSWFVLGLRRCKFAAYLQNVVILHRVILLCQIELLKERSTYFCSRQIRECLYSIMLKPVTSDSHVIDQVVEYDRDGKQTKKNMVHIPEISTLPDMFSLGSTSKDARLRILFSVLGISDDQIPNICAENESTMLLVAVLSHWIKYAEPKVTRNHLLSVLVCTLLMHVRVLKWVNEKISLGGSPVKPLLHEDITVAYNKSIDQHLKSFQKHMDKYFQKPEHSSKHPRDNQTVHGFSQLQACLYDTIHLNQLLIYPVTPPSPSLIFNSTFVYNLCRDLENKVNPDLFIMEKLGNGSPLHELFTNIVTTVLQITGADHFQEAKTRSNASHKKSKSKSKKAKKQKVGSHVVETSHSEESKTNCRVSVNCNVNNRFALLDMED